MTAVEIKREKKKLETESDKRQRNRLESLLLNGGGRKLTRRKLVRRHKPKT